MFRLPRSAICAHLSAKASSPISRAISSQARSGGQVERTEPGDLAEPGLSSVLCCAPSSMPSPFVHVDQALHGQLDLRPSSVEEGVVGRHLVLAIGAQDAARLAVDRQPAATSPRMLDHAAVADRCAVPKSVRFAQVAFQLGEQPGHGVGVVPDVRAGALAAADAFPAVEPARWRTGARSRWPGSRC